MTSKASNAIREEVKHINQVAKIEKDLEARLSSGFDQALNDYALESLKQIEGAEEMEASDVELVVRRAQSNIAHRNLIRQTQFLIKEPRWYANLVAQAAVTVGGFYAVEAGRAWYQNRKNNEAFSETGTTSYKAPRTLRSHKDTSVSAVS